MAEMTLGQHLKELRACLRPVIIVTLLCAASFVLLSPFTIQYIVKPALDCGVTLGVESPTEYLGSIARLAFIAGSTATLPLWLIQIFRFARPALSWAESRIALTLMFLSVCLFDAGIVVGLFFVLPAATQFLHRVDPQLLERSWQLKPYVRFVLRVVFGTALVCEIPVLTAIFTVVCVQVGLRKRRLLLSVGLAIASIIGLVFVDSLLAIAQGGYLILIPAIVLSVMFIPPTMFRRVLLLLGRLSNWARRLSSGIAAEIEYEVSKTTNNL